ncbi:unnamed protein product [Cunninghamella echinulata]
MFDIIYITWFVSITTAFISDKFWFTYLAIPGYALYKGLPFVLSYFGSGGGNNLVDQSDNSGKSKRQQKMEKRGGKTKYVR